MSTRFNQNLYLPLALVLFLSFTKVSINAIPISPDKYYIDPTDSTQLTQKLTVYGKEELSSEQTLYFSVVGMKKIGDQNDREFYTPNPKDASEPANWILLETNTATINPGESIDINWTITPPQNLNCVTNLAAIMVSNKPPVNNSDTTTITIEKEIVSQIHLTADANKVDCKENLTLSDFKVARRFKIFSYDNIPFETTIQNDGDIISKSPIGFIELFGLGDKISVPFNESKLDIYPGTTRKFENIWIDPNYPKDGNFFTKLAYELAHLRFGKYEARLGITKNVDTQILSYDTFWILPWRVILVLAIITITPIGLLKLKSKISSSQKQ